MLNLITKIATIIDRVKTANRLEALDDRTLNDIGITRWDIEDIRYGR